MRLSDSELPETQWLESVASFLASRPPSKWTDTDEGQFQHELMVLGTRFARIESMLFGSAVGPCQVAGLRVTMTRSDGRERDRVVHLDHAQEEAIADTEAAILRLVTAQGNAGLVAVSSALWKVLSDAGEDHE
jgi:hypothetical protein